jgi:uncharacterized membrane protein
MDKELVIIVPDEKAAYQMQKALSALDDDGTIELYASTVVTKRSDGTIDTINAKDNPVSWGTALGLSSGALLGLLAGPAGVALGAAVGGSIGLTTDLAVSGFSGDFVYDAGQKLQPGRYAVCASIWEDWSIPVDVAVAAVGGHVMRQSTEDLVSAQLRAEEQSMKDEWAHFEAEVASSKGEAKAKLEARRNELKAKHAARREELRARAAKLQSRWDAKIASIDSKTERAQADAKARHRRHHDKLAQFAATQKAAFKELFASA